MMPLAHEQRAVALVQFQAYSEDGVEEPIYADDSPAYLAPGDVVRHPHKKNVWYVVEHERLYTVFEIRALLAGEQA
jgi:hypothetical protein